MKVCPSCNARVPDDAPVCRSCDHQFEENVRAQKQTMMGMPVADDGGDQNKTLMGVPVVGGEESESEEDDDGPTMSVSRSDLARALQKVKQKSGKQQEEPEDDSTRQVSPEEVKGIADALGGGQDDDSEPEEAATAVVNPDELNFPESFKEDLSLGDLDSSQSAQRSEDESPPKPSDSDSEEGDFDTYEGISVDEMPGGDDGAAMQVGGGSTEAESDVSTQALSPEQLAKVDEMGLDAAIEESEGDDVQKTAVLDDPASVDNFQLPTPGGTGGAEELKTPDTGDGDSGADDEYEARRNKQRDTPRSGIFRAAKPKKKSEKKEGSHSGEGSSDDDSSPRSSDTGITGTGTYSMNTGKSGTQSETPFGESDKDLKMGTVGGGGRTSFPAGSGGEESQPGTGTKEEQQPEKLQPDLAVESPESSRPDTGPAFAVGGPDKMDEEQEESPIAEPVGESSGLETSGDSVPDVSAVVPMDVEDVSEENPDVEEPPLDVAPGSGEPEATQSTPEAVGAAQPAFGSEPTSSPPQTEPPGGETDAAGGEAEAAAGTPEVKQPPAASPGMEAGQAQQPQQQGTVEPAAKGPSDRAEKADSGGLDTEKIVGLMQRGFGVLAALMMTVIAVVAVVLDGIPEGAADIAVVAMPVVVALIALVLTVLSITNRARSVAYSAVGGLGVVGFAVMLAMGFAPILAVAMFAGGALLLFAAIFPLIGNVVE